MNALLRRLRRLWGQSRIRLLRYPAGPEEIGPGDRLQILSTVWRVQGRLRLGAREGGGWMFRLEAVGEVPGEREARLVAGAEGAWRLVVDGAERLLPPESVVVFPASRGTALTNRGSTA